MGADSVAMHERLAAHDRIDLGVVIGLAQLGNFGELVRVHNTRSAHDVATCVLKVVARVAVSV